MKSNPAQSDIKSRCIETGMAATLICLLLHVFVPKIPFTAAAAIGFLVISMTSPKTLAPLATLWFAFSEKLGKIMSPVLLGAVFFMIVTPIGFLVRRLRKDTLQLDEFGQGESSVFQHRNHTYTKDDLSHPY